MSRRRLLAQRTLLGLAIAGLLGGGLWRFLGVSPSAIRIPIESAIPGVLSADLPGEIELLNPRSLWLLVILPWFVLATESSLVDLALTQRILGWFTRMMLVVALVTALTRPTAVTNSARICTVFAIDVSDSVSGASINIAQQTVERALARRGQHDAHVLTFARRPRVVRTTTGPHAPGGVEVERHEGGGAGTNLAAALSLSYGLFPAGSLRRVVVLSDGAQTDGDVLSEAHRAARFGVRVSVLPMRGASPPEVAVRDLRFPEHVRVNEPFDIRASVFSTREARVAFTLAQGESVNGLDGNREVTLSPGENELRFRSIVRVPGRITYSLSASPAPDSDRFRENNRFVSALDVPGPPVVLYVEGDSSHSQYFRAALSGGEFELETREPREFPMSLRELERFDFVVLSDVGAESIPQGAQVALGRYVRELGGGFMMAGGPRGFGLGGWQGTEIERILPVRMESERRRDQPSLALSLVIDRSGSMQGTPLLLAQSAALAAARALGPDDLVEVIAFDSEPDRVVRMQPTRNRVRIENELQRLRSRGGTAIFPALDAAAQDLAVTRAITRHVILLTDGEGQPDEPPRIQTLVDAMFGDGVTVSTVGLGVSVNRPLLEGVAHRGHGRSYFTADASNLPQIFLRETNLVARSAAIEEPVQPRVVTQATFLRELGAGAPYLYGYVSTRAKAQPAQVMLETDTSTPEPLLARWRVGLGWSLAWTSDLKNRWAVEWVRWPRWAAFWTQLIREHMRQHLRHELGMRAEMVAGTLHVTVDAISDNDRFDNGLSSELSVVGPAPGEREERVAMRQVAPGRYEAVVPLDRYGAFTLRATHRRDGRVVAESRGQVNNPYPREYAALSADEATLAALARVTGGVVDPSPQAIWDARGDTVRHTRALWRWPVGVAVLLLLVDVLLRRVRLFDRDFHQQKRSGR